MKTIKSELVALFDIDDCLLFESANKGIPVEYINPYTYKKEDRSFSQKHVDFLIELKKRGYFIILHSAGGAKHAEQTAKFLYIDKYVDLCLTKSVIYIDDKTDTSDIVGKRVFLEKEN